MKKEKKPWNHNYAYHKWIAKMIGGRKRILDVGCGDGTLARFLGAADHTVLGLDPSTVAIERANAQNTCDNVAFAQAAFESYDFGGQVFDAVVFVASLHHMDMAEALAKAKTLLEENGVLIVVGLTKPSSLRDRLVEAARVVPSWVVSTAKKNVTSEELEIDVSYEFPPMDEVRRICGELLPGYAIRYGLHYRYLLTWEKK